MLNKRILCDVAVMGQLTPNNDLNHYLRPVNQACWHLHPQFHIKGAVPADSTGTVMTFKHELYEGVSPTGYEYHTTSFYGYDSLSGGYLCEELDVRRRQQSDTTYAGTTTVPQLYTFLGATKSSGTNDGIVEHSQMALIVNNISKPPKVLPYHPSHGANVNRLFGFENLDFADYSDLSSPNYIRTINSISASDSFTFQSVDVPKLLQGSSAFVRCNTFTHQSFNGRTSSMSKILYHIPRFSDTGEDTGALYFTPNQMVFLKLNNPAPITLNDIQIDIVDKSEKPLQDLHGNTIVVLYIK